jgi:hypothetical protein
METKNVLFQEPKWKAKTGQETHGEAGRSRHARELSNNIQ